ncbi:acyltransferase [Bacteroides cellulosilyticus]|jgi:hypothetical protein|uniref:Bacterial transferase hexapeptide repeat protein n=2 Tax=Bacteroides TaxID=816 RepID=E2N8R7_9BACE|nr:hypothetical protein [Bacteroides cellulosilyticus]EEF91626.1 hypothetical protein BACCELL_00662 [Bacteroides cellulosilyticus DSM 14838]MBN9708501.1 hypothetical protein [Bacteroides cellulosilyticus]MDC7303452.1 hypothetical protein [Bacteroides cellulosilyticus DSM 14838]
MTLMPVHIFAKIKDLICTIYFNFKYLPYRQACKLPIFVHNIKFVDMKGNIRIECDNIRMGMISFGYWGVCIFPNTGFVWQNHGGTVVFKGACCIGAGSALSINAHATLIFGDDFLNTAGLKIIASRTIEFGQSARLGWNSFVLDTNMHPLKNSITNEKGRCGANIKIGDYNWFGTNCIILPGVQTPERIICGLGTIVPRNIEWKSFCLYGGSPIKILRENVYRDYNDDKDDMII